ncbi:MAG: hypothetical protein F6K40_30605 [Okeania sp. SIO3I5]|uniref:DUF6232 family protein n=1 Tax=Okeania sp. SIO3I5 TaxID=2607805 RepID=UPI0013BD4C60|nr:DUF6232 family protein [Okeania sp. SIO3I5]NEQ40350.1 hypothetical protein [Okeania sp. SIO3I5]
MSNPFVNGKNITIKRGERNILVTKRTIRFGKSVYQTSNIAGFSEGEVETAGIPWVFLIILMIVGLIIMAANSNNNVGSILTIISILGAFWNIFKPKEYGLLLTINSGNEILFSSSREGMEKTISEIYKFIESEEDSTYKISINNSSVSGNLVQGVGGNVRAKAVSSLKN